MHRGGGEGPKGGSLITPNIADSYDREVMAVPAGPAIHAARVATGIQQHKVARITSADLLTRMEWNIKALRGARLPCNSPSSPTWGPGGTTAGGCAAGRWPRGHRRPVRCAAGCTRKAATLLLNLEFSGVVRSLPGKVHELH
ncbi:MAG: hypothetical protein IPM68_14445 [Flavobacteriales bacterium]|nr:hypothetical protein [Flavobacteriales bacterium]